MSRQRAGHDLPVIQLDNLTSTKKQKLAEKVRSLGGRFLDGEEFQKNTTHVVCDVIRLSEKFLGACVKGLWVVSTNYIKDSFKVGQWLDAKDYEHRVKDPRQESELVSAYKRWHWRVTMFKEPPFNEWKVALFVETSKMAVFKRLLTFGGAQIISLSLPLDEDRPVPDVTYVIMDSSHIRLAEGVLEFGLLCLDQKFVTDTIIKDEELDPFNYLVSKPISNNFGFTPNDNLDASHSQSQSDGFDASNDQTDVTTSQSPSHGFDTENNQIDASDNQPQSHGFDTENHQIDASDNQPQSHGFDTQNNQIDASDCQPESLGFDASSDQADVTDSQPESLGFDASSDQADATDSQSQSHRFDTENNQIDASDMQPESLGFDASNDHGSNSNDFDAGEIEMDTPNIDQNKMDDSDSNLVETSNSNMSADGSEYSDQDSNNAVSDSSVIKQIKRPLYEGLQNGQPSSRDISISSKPLKKKRKDNQINTSTAYDNSSHLLVSLCKDNISCDKRPSHTKQKKLVSKDHCRDNLLEQNNKKADPTQINFECQPSLKKNIGIVTVGLKDQNVQNIKRREESSPLDSCRKRTCLQVKALDPNVPVDGQGRKNGDSNVTGCKRKLFDNDSNSNSPPELKRARGDNILNDVCSRKHLRTFLEKNTPEKKSCSPEVCVEKVLSEIGSDTPASPCIPVKKHSKNPFPSSSAADLGGMQNGTEDGSEAKDLHRKKTKIKIKNKSVPVVLSTPLPVSVHLYGLQESTETDSCGTLPNPRTEPQESVKVDKNRKSHIGNKIKKRKKRENSLKNSSSSGDSSGEDSDTGLSQSSPVVSPSLRFCLSPNIYLHTNSSLERRKTDKKKVMEKKTENKTKTSQMLEMHQSVKANQASIKSSSLNQGEDSPKTGKSDQPCTSSKKSSSNVKALTKFSESPEPSNKLKLSERSKSSLPSSQSSSSSSQPLQSAPPSHVQTSLSSFGFVSKSKKAHIHSTPKSHTKNQSCHTDSPDASKGTKRGLAKNGQKNSTEPLDPIISIKKETESPPRGSFSHSIHESLRSVDSNQHTDIIEASSPLDICEKSSSVLQMEKVPLNEKKGISISQSKEILPLKKNEIGNQTVSRKDVDLQGEIAFPKTDAQNFKNDIGLLCSEPIVISDDESEDEFVALTNEMKSLDNTLNEIREFKINRCSVVDPEIDKTSDKESGTEVGGSTLNFQDFKASENDSIEHVSLLEIETHEAGKELTSHLEPKILSSLTVKDRNVSSLNCDSECNKLPTENCSSYSSNMNLCDITKTESSLTRSEQGSETETHTGDDFIINSNEQEDHSSISHTKSTSEPASDFQGKNDCPGKSLEWPMSFPLCINPFECKEKSSLPIIFGQWMEADREMGFSHSAVAHGKPCSENRPTTLLLSEIITLVQNENPHIRAEAFNSLMSWVELHPPVTPSVIKLYSETFQLSCHPSLFVFDVISDLISESGDINLGAVLLLEYFVSVFEINFNYCLKMGDKVSLKNSLIVKLLWKDPFAVFHCSKECHKLLDIFGKAVSLPQLNLRVCNAVCSMIALAAECIRIANVRWSPQNHKFLSESVLKLADDLSRKISSRPQQTILTLLHLLKPAWLRALVTAVILSSYNTYLLSENISISNLSLCSIVSQFFFLVPPLQHSHANLSIKTGKEEPMQENVSSFTLKKLDSVNITDNNCSPVKDFAQKRKLTADRINKRNHNGESALHVACIRKKASKVKEYLSVPGVDVNMRDNCGWTPLHEACSHGSYECVELLLRHVPDMSTSGALEQSTSKVEINAIGPQGFTPLHDAVRNNHVDICKLLLRYGGQKLLTTKTVLNFSALDFAETDEMRNALTTVSVDSFDSQSDNDSFVGSQSSQSHRTGSVLLETIPLPSLYREIVGTDKSQVVSLGECSKFLSLLGILVTSYFSAMDLPVQSGSYLNAQDSEVLTNVKAYLRQLKKHVKKITKREDYEALQTDLILMEIVCFSKEQNR